jgi:hypothetical protein
MKHQSNGSCPEDLRPRYLSLARRIQSAGCEYRGVSLVSITVAVDENGNPTYWTEPRTVNIEPAANREIIEFLASQAPIPQKV